jgi:hypothetical protein
MRLPEILFAAILFVCLPGVGSATLIVNSVSNTPSSFAANLTWSEPSVVDSVDLGSSPWSIKVIASGIGDVLLVMGQHAFSFHSGEAPYGGALQLIFQGVSPGVGSASSHDLALHPFNHYDHLNASVIPIGLNQSSIQINAVHTTHTPEPGTFGLATMTAAAMFLLVRLRKGECKFRRVRLNAPKSWQ